MTATDAENAAAAAAFEAGTAASLAYHGATGQAAGVGSPVALPSADSPLGPVQGMGFDRPEAAPGPSVQPTA
jgi:hypothetical protein